ncbi:MULTISPECIES: DUF4153 domain-containing protein [unclassified Saccharothrix]|uniref:DUF4153 domain-containing protein n=1 Tax=unclassified Saccharothrix TaxID=2593673 RepID=UPI00307F3C9A
MSPHRALLTGIVGGTSAAVLLPLDEPGLGWLLTAAVVFALVRKVRPGWAALSLLLFGTGALVADADLFALCAVAGCAAGSLAVVGGRTAKGLLLGSTAVPVAILRAVPWAARGVKTSKATELVRPLAVTAAVLAVFLPLLAGADVAFAEMIGESAPELDGQWVVVFAAVGSGLIGACYLTTLPPAEEQPARRRTVALREWAMPVWALVGLFAAFVGVQVSTLFGGDDYVLRTAGVTYAEYARRGFWQLLAVAVLTLGVIAVAARVAEDGDRKWLRGLLGALTGLTLVIVASALNRMWVYQQAYGFTTLRVLVSACELWLALVYLMVLVAGVRLRGGWLPRAVVGSGFAALVGLALLNPDRFIAERNAARWQETGKIDLVYLGRLSDDAVPALAALPEPMRQCVLRHRRVSEDDWRSWNLARSRAREALRDFRPQGSPCAW